MVFRRDASAGQNLPLSPSMPAENSFHKMSQAEILKSTGIPPAFADLLKRLSLEKNIAIAIRGGSPFQRYLMPCSPKPSSVKAKTGNWGFTKGVISEDQALGKKEESANGEWVIKSRDDKKELPLGKGIVEPIVHKLSLNEVLVGISAGDYNFVSAENGRLVVTAKDAPDNKNFQFSINLNEDPARTEKQMELKNPQQLSLNLQTAEQPSWWEEFGDFAEKAQTYFPAQVRDMSTPEKDFTDIKVYGVITNEMGTVPITGDQDLLWVSRPISLATGKETIVVNTYIQNDVKELADIRLEMALTRAQQDPDNADKYLRIDNATLAGLGCITPFESEVLDDANKEFADQAEHIRDLFQHGAENRNPGIPSPLDAPMVHIWQGEIYMTQNEKELLDFVMQPGYLEENIIDVHPKWDMQKWSPVVEKQFQLQQPVPPATFMALVEYQYGRHTSLSQDKKNQYVEQVELQLKNLKEGQQLPVLTTRIFAAIQKDLATPVFRGSPRHGELPPMEFGMGGQPPTPKHAVKSSTSKMAKLLGKEVLKPKIMDLPPLEAKEPNREVKENVEKARKVQENSADKENKVILPSITRKR